MLALFLLVLNRFILHADSSFMQGINPVCLNIWRNAEQKILFCRMVDQESLLTGQAALFLVQMENTDI